MKLNSNNNSKIFADKVSGLEGSVLLCSVFVEIIRLFEKQSRFKLHWYGDIIDANAHKLDEFGMLDAYKKESERIVRYVIKNGLDYFKDLRNTIHNEADKFLIIARNSIADLHLLTDEEFIRRYNALLNESFFRYGMGAVTFIYEGILSDDLVDSLRKKSDDVASILPSLLKSDYKSFMIESDNLIKKIKVATNEADKNEFINEYLDNFFYIDSNYYKTPTLYKSDIIRKISEFKLDDNEIASVTSKQITLNTREKAIINLFKETEVIRDQRKRIATIGNFAMGKFAEEAARRLNLPRDIIVNALWYEFPMMFNDKKILEKIKHRDKVSVYYDGKKCHYLEGTFIQDNSNISSKVSQIKGTTASVGNVTGKVKIVLNSGQFKQFNKDEILVAEMTRPDFLPIMKLAKAIITDEGGLTCHAAVVARELHIPCIVGTRFVTKVLQDGDLVEVDANKGIVRKINDK